MKKLLTTPVMGCTLVILSLTSLFVGVKSIPLEQITHLDQSQVDIFLASRLPRTISISLWPADATTHPKQVRFTDNFRDYGLGEIRSSCYADFL